MRLFSMTNFLIEARNAWNSAFYLRRDMMMIAMISMFLIVVSGANFLRVQ